MNGKVFSVMSPINYQMNSPGIFSGNDLVKNYSGVAPANQAEESEVRELSRKESGICSETPFFGRFVKHLQAKGGSGNQFRAPSPEVRKPHFLRFGLPEPLLDDLQEVIHLDLFPVGTACGDNGNLQEPNPSFRPILFC